MERDEKTQNLEKDENFNEYKTFTELKVHLDRVGEVLLSLDSSGLSWKLLDPHKNDESYCLCRSACLCWKLHAASAGEVYFSDIYAVELVDWGAIRHLNGSIFRHQETMMYRFTVHAKQRCQGKPSLWKLAEFTFGHKDQLICQMLVNDINGFLKRETGRPKNLLVFVNPKSGKGNGQRIWEVVAPIFSRANVRAHVIITDRAGHAFDAVKSIANRELKSYDGIVAVGGDGLFNEILNGILTSRLKTIDPLTPPDFLSSPDEEPSALVSEPNKTAAGTSPNEDQSPLLPTSRPCASGSPSLLTEGGVCSTADEDSEFSFPHKWFRFGIIPAGSTDATVICTTGVRDAVTSALHIVLGKRIGLDIAQVVRWKATKESKVEPFVRYTASFVGYGFYGDVIVESEKYRWMGPKRYDVAGTHVFLKHRSYEAEIAYMDVKSNKTDPDIEEDGANEKTGSRRWGQQRKRSRQICRTNCEICSKPCSIVEEPKWLKSRGQFLSAGAAVISCRNERAPDGLVAEAHLSDGFLHLILIRSCPHPLYLWHLTHLARKGGSPLDFNFVEHHKTPAFAFTSFGKESVWNLDGEILHAHKLSAQVLRSLISLFAAGPEV